MPLSLLLVDDDEVDREAVRRTLLAAGIDAELTGARTAAEAFEAAAARPFDCILLDYRLSDTDGLAVLESLRARGIDTPVVALTGVADQSTAVAMMKAGAADYLVKGAVTPDGLERSIRHAMRLAAGERERRELLRREQLARQEAQAANHAKDEFLATLSHELRTPLNSILGWTHLLVNGLLDAGGQQRALETIQRNARLQAKLVDDLLDISRIVTGRLTIEREQVSLASVVAAVVDSQRPAAVEAGVELTYTAAADEGLVIGDAARLQQVVINLLSNALKFTPSGGRVQVELSFDAGQAHLRVADSGIGIPAEFLPHVFEQFRQADASTTRRQGGLGLGLAIVRRLVELHEGTVTARSDGPARGTTLTVSIPLALGAVQADGARSAPRRDLAGVSILLVDDDEDGRAFLAAILDQRGARVQTAGSAAEALAVAARSTPDILLSDIAMPDCDGFDLIARFRGVLPDTPAAAVTACIGPEMEARVRSAGFDAHVPKPVDPDQAVATVLELCRRNARRLP